MFNQNKIKLSKWKNKIMENYKTKLIHHNKH